jgi:undecaprenyl diphosphate synthase
MNPAAKTGPAPSLAVDPGVAAAVARLRAVVPKADPLSVLPDVHPARLPRHVAVIMDGNGRWAEQRGFPRVFGHRNGVRAVRTIVTECVRLGIECLTLYSFSMENWKRPQEEIDGLMTLCLSYLEGERESMVRDGIRFRVIGRRDPLPDEVLRAIDRVVDATKDCKGPTLCLAMNYGSRAEIVDAARSLAADVAAGKLPLDQIDEAALAERLYTVGLPDPDLLVRTAGEMRISNYLLWQISYAELYVTDTLWPDFDAPAFHAAIRAYASRSRRFGGL